MACRKRYPFFSYNKWPPAGSATRFISPLPPTEGQCYETSVAFPNVIGFATKPAARFGVMSVPKRSIYGYALTTIASTSATVVAAASCCLKMGGRPYMERLRAELTLWRREVAGVAGHAFGDAEVVDVAVEITNGF